MKFKNILILILLLSLTFSAQAQNRPNRGGNGGFDVEKLKREKADFIKKELNLTDKEAKEFLPLEDEFMQKKFDIYRDSRRKTRELRKKENKTEADYQEITKIGLEAEQKEAQLQIEYYKKFGKVLSAEKVEKYRRADIKFKEEALKRHKERERSRNTGAPRRQ